MNAKMMKGKVLLLLLATALLPAWTQPQGWATVDGMTDGGRGEHPVLVSSFTELELAVPANDTIPRTIYLQGRIRVPGLFGIKRVKNKSIIGLPGSALINDKYTLDKDSTGILMLDGCQNIILQNITFIGPGAFDRDANDNLFVTRSQHVWIDHCDFQDGMDGNFDCNQGSDYITVSWCRFRYLRQPWPKLEDDENDDHNSDHRFSNLWGSSDREGPRSEGRLRTTFDHCWWDEGCQARMPFVRFGQIHLLNCLYSSSVASVYIQARYRSNVLVDRCAFVDRPSQTRLFQIPLSSRPELMDYNIRFSGCLGAEDLSQRHGQAAYFTPPYQFLATKASLVEQAVKAGAGATLQPQVELPRIQGLKDAYRDYFLIGVSVNQRNVANAQQQALIRQEFSSMTCENDMKPGPTEPQQGVFNWERADRIADFARQNGIKLRGHCLMWHSQVGRWMTEDNPSPEVFYERMRNHIQAVVSRYKDVVYCWDVVNEAISDNPLAEHPYRESAMYRLCGDEFIAKAFEYAREADPDALLFYNDYNECDPVKSRRIYEMVKKMKEAGVPIDGIGMQGHYNIYSPTEEDLDKAIELYSQVVDHIHITELDVRVNTERGGQLSFSRQGVAVNDTTDQYLADQYARLFRVFRKHKNVIDCVTFWNLSDRDSWLGQNNYPLPFDARYQPKKAYYYIRDFHSPRWPRPSPRKSGPARVE